MSKYPGWSDYDEDCASLLPDNAREGLEAYVTEGIPTGDFLRACLENNFVEAVGRADIFNQRALPEIACFIYQCLPQVCWGSPEKVKRWLEEMKNKREEANE